MINIEFDQLENGGPDSILISFCNQGASPEFSLCVFNLFERSFTWIPLSELYILSQSGLGGVCGIAFEHGQIFIVTQGYNPLLACWDIKAKSWISKIILQKVSDAHSIVIKDGYIYIVSTGTNEIYRVKWDGCSFHCEEIYWQYPGVSYDYDVVHLNGLTRDGERLIASCFGFRDDEGVWGASGEVFYVDPVLQAICSNLNHPHTPLMIGKELYIAESKSGLVHRLIKENDFWVPETAYPVGGYVRGISFIRNKMIVGVSASRTISRSKKCKIEKTYSQNADYGVAIVDMTTKSVVREHITSGLGKEIYDLIPVAGFHDGNNLEGVLAMRIHNMEITYEENSVASYEASKEYEKVLKDFNLLKNKEQRRLANRIKRWLINWIPV